MIVKIRLIATFKDSSKEAVFEKVIDVGVPDDFYDWDIDSQSEYMEHDMVRFSDGLTRTKIEIVNE